MSERDSIDRRGHHLGLAFFYMGLAMVLIPCLNASGKYLGQRYSIVEITWARYAGHFIYMVIFFIPWHGSRLFRTTHFKTQILRSTLLLASTGIYFSALRFTSLPVAASISFVSPFLVIALARVVLGERAGWQRWLAAGIGFSGCLLVAAPGIGNGAARLVPGAGKLGLQCVLS